jgi:hypothetical protein
MKKFLTIGALVALLLFPAFAAPPALACGGYGAASYASGYASAYYAPTYFPQQYTTYSYSQPLTSMYMPTMAAPLMYQPQAQYSAQYAPAASQQQTTTTTTVTTAAYNAVAPQAQVTTTVTEIPAASVTPMYSYSPYPAAYAYQPFSLYGNFYRGYGGYSGQVSRGFNFYR